MIRRKILLNAGKGQTKPLIITAGRPNVWTLEQAHYLLAQIHRRNLDLKTRKLDRYGFRLKNISSTREIAIPESRLKRAEGDEKDKINAQLEEKKAKRAVVRE